MATSYSPEQDCVCPVCCDFYSNPVVLLCGHSFCQVCLREWWTQSGHQTCPVCKDVFPMRQPPRNLALKSLSDSLKEAREREQRALFSTSTTEGFCAVHGEKFKLFCMDDRKPICVVCRDAKEHRKHDCVPLNEAAKDRKEELKIALMHLKTKLGKFNQKKMEWDKMASHIKVQAQRTEEWIKGEFQKVYQLLRAEELTRIDGLRKEAEQKNEAMRIKLINLTTEIVSLSDTIKAAEEQLKTEEDLTLMLKYKGAADRAHCKLPDPETPSGALIDEVKHRANLPFNVWMMMKKMIQYTAVHMDPNTASSILLLSDNLKSVAPHVDNKKLPSNPERCGSCDILGSPAFSSGRHTWDVEVGGHWAVGVAAKTQPDTKRWGIYMCVCTGFLRELTPEDYVKLICEDSFPSKIRVCLDYDLGKLSFYDLNRKTCVHTITYTFKEPLLPYFSANVKLLPIELSLKAK